MNGRRLSNEEIKARFAAMRAEHEAKAEQARKAKEAHAFLKASRTASVAPSLGDALRDAYREGARFRDTRGRFMGLPKG